MNTIKGPDPITMKKNNYGAKERDYIKKTCLRVQEIKPMGPKEK